MLTKFLNWIERILEACGYHSTAKMEFNVEQAAKATEKAKENDWLQLMQLGGPQLRAAINSALAALATLEGELIDASNLEGAAQRAWEEAQLRYEFAATRYNIALAALGPLRSLQLYGDDMETIRRQAPAALTTNDLKVVERSA